jgi:Periplasmic binding protein
MFPPERIICLTEETVETLYLLGEDFRIVGISGYAVRPPRARREKPRVCAFTSADIPKILNLKPDLVLTFSDLQADIAATDVIRNEPDIIIGSWCGKKFRPEKLAKQPAFDGVPLHEIKSPLILQPGPAALTDGLAALQAIIANAIS